MAFFFLLHQNRKQLNLLQQFLKLSCRESVALVSQIRLLFVCLFFSSRELDFICIAMTPKCSVRHYKRQISCFPEAKVLLRHSTPFSVTSLANPEWALVDELGLSPSWWQRRPLPPQCQPQGVGVTQSGSFHPDASVGKDTFHLCEAKKMRERCGS